MEEKNKEMQEEKKTAETVKELPADNENNTEEISGLEETGGKKGKKKKKRSKYGYLKRFILKLVFLGVMFWAVSTYVLTAQRMTGNYMYPMVKDGDLCIFYKLDSYHLADVALYKTASGQKKIGRVVAVGGQEVDFPEEGGYLINSYEPSEEVLYPTYRAEVSSVRFPITLSDDGYFILNDFRKDSNDSRAFGEVKEEDLQGKLIFILRRRGF